MFIIYSHVSLDYQMCCTLYKCISSTFLLFDSICLLSLSFYISDYLSSCLPTYMSVYLQQNRKLIYSFSFHYLSASRVHMDTRNYWSCGQFVFLGVYHHPSPWGLCCVQITCNKVSFLNRRLDSN